MGNTSSATDTLTDQYDVWFGHTGRPVANNSKWMDNGTEKYTLKTIVREVKRHKITHLKIWYKIPPEIHSLAPDLSHLYIRQPQSPESLQSIEKLQRLEILYLYGVPSIPEECLNILPTLTELKKLWLRECGLKYLPTNLSELKTLEMVYMRDVKVSAEILEVISTLSMLKTLDLSTCFVTDLPERLSVLERLEVLILFNNKSLSAKALEVVTSLTTLKFLDLTSCSLTRLPKRLLDLNNLQVLKLSWNKLFAEDLEVISALPSLQRLDLKICSLTFLPPQMKRLEKLEILNLWKNDFTFLPPVICELKSLKELYLFENQGLRTLDAGILNLTNLHTLDTSSCDSLRKPPKEVCRQGLPAIRQYYADIKKSGEGHNLPQVTIAVIGQKMAGKTSLVKTLQSKERQRIFTKRDPDKPYDESTKVFNVEEVEVEGTILRFIDMGGHEVYHLAYQLTLRQNCIPVIVVSIKQYKEMLKEMSEKEVVRRLFLDWMSHLYLSCPDLGSPKLVITHKDTIVDQSEYLKLKTEFLAISETLKREILHEEKLAGGNACKIEHFSRDNLFSPDDIYDVGDDGAQYETFEQIKKSLLEESQQFIKPIPRSWQLIEESLKSLTPCFMLFDELLERVQKDYQVEKQQLEIILNFMHDCGRLFWYRQEDSLSPFVFCKIAEVTKLLNTIFHHNSTEQWQNRLDTFESFLSSTGKRVGKADYEEMVKYFKKTGAMNKHVLCHLLATETSFKTAKELEVALSLLKTFRLLHGPMKNNTYTVPYFASGYQNDVSSTTERDLSFRVDLIFNGLSLPEYVFHQMTIGLLELFTDETKTPIVKHNGATVFCGKTIVRITHDYKSKKAVIELNSPVENMVDSWSLLVNIVNNTIKHTSEAWRASIPKCIFYCLHCLLRGNLQPQRQVNPYWCSLSLRDSTEHQKHKDIEPVLCDNDGDVPKPLVFPCVELTKKDIKKLKEYVKEQQKYNQTSQLERGDIRARTESQSLTPEKSKWESYSSTELTQRHVVSQEHSQAHQSSQQSADAGKEDYESDISDGEGYLLPEDPSNAEKIKIKRKLLITRDQWCKDLFVNTDKVYKMTPNIRGRALIINNRNFDGSSKLLRRGSEEDVRNMVRLLEQLKYDVFTKDDLTAEGILKEIKTETQDPGHKSYGMFVLVIMSHGTEKNHIFGSDLNLVDLKDVYDLLTPTKFSAMSGKPKLVIIEACRGLKKDFGDKGVHEPDVTVPAPLEHAPDLAVEECSTPRQSEYPTSGRISRSDVDDLFIIQSSFEAYIANRHWDCGSMFIRCLVTTLYSHACHRDMYSLYKIIQNRVDKLSKDLTEKYPYCTSVQKVVAMETLTNGRKLYLFPGYDGPTERYQ